MQITNKEYKKWKFLGEHGDYEAISQTLPKPDYRKVSNAFKLKKCSEEVYNAIKSFYAEREVRVSKQEQDQD